MRKSVMDDYNVACPLCKAKIGENCINIGHGTRFPNEVHRERRRAAEQLEAARGL